MNRTTATLVTTLVGGLAIVLPIALALYVANRQGEEYERARVMGYAQEVLHRSDRAANQIYDAIDRLVVNADGSDSCSETQMVLMREIDLASSYIQAVGKVAGNQLVCSSLSTRNELPLDLGAPDVVTSTGSKARSNVEFPFARGFRFTVIERKGYAAIIHKDLPIDVSAAATDLALATITPDNRQIRSSRGSVRVEWIDRLGDHFEASFVDGQHIVAVARSRRYATIAVAALPVRHMEAYIRGVALLLVPAGLAASGLLVWAILYAMRMRLAMPAILKVALRRKELFMVYQPVVDLQTYRWIGAEALVRWRRPSGELVRPDIFIPVAEDSGLISAITEEVLRLIAHDAADFFREHPGFHIGINLAATDFHSKRTLELISQVANDTSAGPGNLLIEATERGFMHADSAREVLRAVRAGGVRVAIDDFGTGYSSLSYLGTFELDYLKIDKSFVDKIATEAAASQVVPHIIEMAKSLGLEMIAEGVETEAQAAFLRERGVQYAQGWLFSKPLSFSELQAGLAAQQEALSKAREAGG